MASFCQNYSSRNVLTVFLGFEFSESRPTFFNLVLIIIILIKNIRENVCYFAAPEDAYVGASRKNY